MLKRKLAERLHRSETDRDAGDRFFSLLENLYGLGVEYRNRRLDRGKGLLRLPVPVISVGNIVVGGTGKTPMVRFLARLLAEKGMKAAILSRGYGGKLEKKGGWVSDGKEIFLSAEEAGDEPFLLASTTPAAVYVGANRYESGLRAIQEGADVLLLDDGFQHRKLHRDIDLVLLDSRNPFGNGHLLPRGILREKPASLLRAHGLVLTHCDGTFSPGDLVFPFSEKGVENLPCFYSAHRQVFASGGSPIPEKIMGRRVLVFSGIADGEGFAKDLGKAGWTVAHSEVFSDHYAYGPGDMAALVAKARSVQAVAIITTAKDAVKLPPSELWPLPLYVLDVELAFQEDTVFLRWLENQLDTCFSL